MTRAGVIMAAIALGGCRGCAGGDSHADAHADADTGAHADADADAHADADADADAHADADADADAEAEAGSGSGAAPLSDEGPLALALVHRWVAGGFLKDTDAPVVEPTMRAAYAQMRAEEIDPKSARHVDRMEIDKDLLVLGGRRRDRGLVVFLHGWGGRWALPCWQVARTVAPLGLVTACPDGGTEAQWWMPDGERIVKKTLALGSLGEIAQRKTILVGLSNGAAGAARMPTKIPGTFAAVVLVSGAEPGLPKTGVPTLVVHGKRDAMTGFAGARAYADKRGATFVPLAAGHFSMLVDADAFEGALFRFCEETMKPDADGGWPRTP